LRAQLTIKAGLDTIEGSVQENLMAAMELVMSKRVHIETTIPSFYFDAR
jgi:hypothetical protein